MNNILYCTSSMLQLLNTFFNEINVMSDKAYFFLKQLISESAPVILIY